MMLAPAAPSTRVQTAATVAGSLVVGLLKRAAMFGVDSTVLTAAASLEPSHLSDPATRIPRRTYHAMFEHAARLSKDPDFGLHCGERVTLDDFHVVGHLANCSATLESALQTIVATHRLLDDGVVTRLEVGPRSSVVASHETSVVAARPRHAAEFAVMSMLKLTRAFLRFDWTPDRVSFTHARPAQVREHLRLLGVTPDFSAPRVEVEVGATVLARPGVDPSTTLMLHLQRYAEQLLQNLPSDDLVSRVEKAIGSRLADGAATLSTVARALAMSERSLQRALAAQKQTFADVLDRMRREAAEHYLERTDMTLTEIAFLVGFADTRSLRRASRRWFGSSSRARRARRVDER